MNRWKFSRVHNNVTQSTSHLYCIVMRAAVCFCFWCFAAALSNMQVGFSFVRSAPRLCVTASPTFFFPQHELELSDEENDDVKDQARDNELDASESARTSCSGFISMSRRGGGRRCQRWSAGCFPEDELEPPDEEDGDDAKDAHTIDLKFELCKVVIHLNTMDKGK